MSSRIDQRIVEMSFENSKFEEGITKSKNSLKGFVEALQNMGHGKDLSGLEDSVATVSNNFSILEQVGVGALRRIGEAAINAGGSLIKSLTLDPLKMGLTKYEQKTASVQTIMNATGKSISEVNGYLDKLMWFSDETSYGFTDMTAALAQMTSSGGNIDTLIPMITGVANATAYAGKGAAEFSRAMYNLNQSYGRGNLEYMDWRSLELAGVAGQDLKQVIIDTGKAMGVLDSNSKTAKGTLVDIGTFSSTLSEKWATTAVMEAGFSKFSEMSEAVYELVNNGTYDTAAEAMQSLTGQYSILAEKGFQSAQQAKSFSEAIAATLDSVSSGWMRTYELIFGEMDEAIRNFSALTEVLWTIFSSGAEARNTMLKLIKDGGGIKKLFQSIKNVAVALLTPLRAISMAFDQFFPPKTSTQWLGVIDILEKVTRKMIITTETASKIQRTFAGFFAVVDIGWEVVKFLGQSLYEIVGAFIPLGDGILGTTASIGDFLVMVNQLIKQSGFFQYALLGVKVAVLLIKNAFTNVISKVSEFLNILWTTDKPLAFIGETVSKSFSGVLDILKSISSWISNKFINGMSAVAKFFGTNFDISDTGAIGGVLKLLRDFISFITGEANDGLKNFNGTLISLDFSKIATFVTGGVLLLFINQLTNLTSSMAGLVTSTTGFVTNFSKKLFGYTTKIKDLAYVFGILSASLYVLSKIPWDDMKVGLKGMALSLGMFVVAYGSIQAITVASSKALKGIDVVASTFSLISLASGIAIMAFAINTLTKIANKGDIWKAVGVMGAMMALLAAYQLVSALISIIPGQTAIAIKFSGMTLGILGLVGIVAVLGAVPNAMFKSGAVKLIAAVALIAAIQTVFALVSRISGGNKLSLNLLGIAGGLAGLLIIMKLLTLISPREITTGLGNIFLMGGVLAALQLMMNVAGVIGGGVAFKTHIFSIEMGIVAMIAIVAILGTMDQTKLQNGIKTIRKMAGIIISLEIFTALAARIGAGNKLQRILGSVTLSMLAFTGLIAVIGWYKPETIDKGLLTITKMLGIILAFEVLSAMGSRLGGSVTGLGSIIGMITALLTITASLVLLSMIDQEALRKATISIGIAVVAIGIMGVGIGLMTNSLTILSGALGSIRTLLHNLIPGFVALGVVIVAAIALLGIINIATPLIESVSWASLGKFAAGLGVISTLVLGFSLLAKMPGLVGGMAGLSVLAPALGAVGIAVIATAGLFYTLGKVLPTIDNMNWNSLGKFIIGIAVIGVMAAGLSLLSVPLSTLSATALPALGGVLVAIAGVGLIIAAFVGLSSLMELLFSGGTDFLMNGIDKLAMVAGGIGRVFGALAGGFNSEILVTYGRGLSKFAESVSTIQPNAFDGVESLARALLVLTGTSILNGLSQLVNGNVNSGELFGQQLKGLIDAFKRISIDDAIRTSAVIAALAPMTENLTKLSQAAQAIPNSGGLAGALFGNNDINTFAPKIGVFIATFQSISIAAATHTSMVLEALGPMITNLKNFARAADNIPNSGGIMEAFMGGNDIDTFGYSISAFINAFARIPIENVGVASAVFVGMTPMLNNLKNFAEVAKDIPNTGGLVALFSGDNDLNVFVQKIVAFVESMNTLDIGEVSVANSNLKSMTTDMLPGLERFASLSNRLTFTGLESLTDFAKKLKSFVGILKNVDFGVVGPALSSLTAINESFKIVGQSSIASATASFENNKAPFHAGIARALDEAITIVVGKKTPIEIAFTSIISNALTQSRKYIGQFKVVGAELINGLVSGIQANSTAATVAAVKMTSDVIKGTRHGFAVESPSKVFANIGGWLGLGLAEGINRNAYTAEAAGINMAYGVENGVRDALGVHSLSTKFKEIGGYVTKSIDVGIKNGKAAVLDTASNLGLNVGDYSITGVAKSIATGEGAVTKGVNSLLELLTGDTSISGLADAFGGKTGTAITDSMANSISGGSGGSRGSGGKSGASKISNAVQAVAEDAYTIFKRYIDDRKEYHLISLQEELAEWENFSKKYAAGTRTRIKADDEVARVKMELDTASFNNSKKWIEKEKYFKRISLLEEVALWEKVQARYAQGHEYRMEAERELFRLKQELQQAEYQNAADRIEEEKYYDRMNLAQELTAWKKIQSKTVANSDERKKADREVYRMEKEIQKAKLDYEKKMADIENTRNEKRIQAEEEYYNKTKEINERLKNDIKALNDEYENAVKARTQALYSSWGLFDAVEIPEADGEELLGNLEDQVVAFDQWQAQITKLAEKGISGGLLKELTDMGPKALPQLVALNKLSDTQLQKYVGLWTEKSVSAKEQAIAELEDMRIQTNDKIKQITRETEAELRKYEAIWRDTLRRINVDANEQLKLLKKTMVQIEAPKAAPKAAINAGRITAPTPTYRPGTTGVSAASTTVIGKVIAANKPLGTAAMTGIAQGIKAATPAPVSAAGKATQSVINAVKKSAGIHSPSKEMAKLGVFLMEGLAVGIKGSADSATEASATVGQTVLDTMQASIANMLTDDTDDLSITPILDLSNIRSGMGNINSMFNSASGLDLGASIYLLPEGNTTNQNGILTDIKNSLVSIRNQEVDLTGMLTIQVSNDRGEIVGIAETAIKDILRRESR